MFSTTRRSTSPPPHPTEQTLTLFKQNFIAIGEHIDCIPSSTPSVISHIGPNSLLELPMEIWLEISKHCPLSTWLGAVLLVSWPGFYTVGSVLFDRYRLDSEKAHAKLYDLLFYPGAKAAIARNPSAQHLVNHTLSGAYKRGSVIQAIENFLQGNQPRTGQDLLTWLNVPKPTNARIPTSEGLIEAINWSADLDEVQKTYCFDNLAWFMCQPKDKAPKPEIFLTLPLTAIQDGFAKIVDGTAEIIDNVEQVAPDFMLMRRMVECHMFDGSPRSVSGGSRYNESAAYAAVLTGKPEVLQKTLDTGVDIDEPGPLGETALHYVAATGNLELLRLLMERGANAILANALGYTPLLLAAINNNLRIARCLLTYPPVVQNINRQNRQGKTALHFAVEKNNEKLVICLLKHKANTEVTNMYGSTPLAHAMKNNLPIALFLATRIEEQVLHRAELKEDESTHPRKKNRLSLEK